MPVAEDTEYLTVEEARIRLGASKQKIADLIREGALQTDASPLDKRVKLIRRADVDALLGKWHRRGSEGTSE